ncbi:scavenger receptor class F member 2-like, partial [Python bivittatus]|uniref:Scavenger receptor class F member 2-like n=1 Tax=Python bivittatus TaxID=176946 RepID=A0A9F5N211_PYTBI
CALRFYGAECGMICSCNGTESCNPLNGQCAENEQCNEDRLRSDCQQDVIHLRCPKDPGWWYWKNSCYYIETTKRLTWGEAKNFCMAYHETKLLPMPQSNEEKVWLTTVLKDVIWIDSAMGKMKDMKN